MSRRTHVLLDLDGTLSHSEPGIMQSLRWACEQEGFPSPTDEEVRSVIGPPFEIGLPSIGIPDDGEHPGGSVVVLSSTISGLSPGAAEVITTSESSSRPRRRNSVKSRAKSSSILRTPASYRPEIQRTSSALSRTSPLLTAPRNSEQVCSGLPGT